MNMHITVNGQRETVTRENAKRLQGRLLDKIAKNQKRSKNRKER